MILFSFQLGHLVSGARRLKANKYIRKQRQFSLINVRVTIHFRYRLIFIGQVTTVMPRETVKHDETILKTQTMVNPQPLARAESLDKSIHLSGFKSSFTY